MNIPYDRFAEIDDITAIWNDYNNYGMIYFCWYYLGTYWTP